MNARTAIRRGIARAISADGFDPTGITNFESLKAELAPEIEQLRAEGELKDDPPSPGTGR